LARRAGQDRRCAVVICSPGVRLGRRGILALRVRRVVRHQGLARRAGRVHGEDCEMTSPLPLTGRCHDLKCWPEPFRAIVAGAKRHEFRRDDRGYALGDVLYLYEWDPSPGLVIT